MVRKVSQRGMTELAVLDPDRHLLAVMIRTVLRCACFAACLGFDFGIFIDIPICMSAYDNRFFPGFNGWFDIIDQNGLSKYSSVQHGPDGSIGTFPLFF